MRRRSVRARGLLGAAGLLAGYLVTADLLLWGSGAALAAVHAAGPATPDAVVALTAGAVAWCVLSWLTGVLLLALLTAVVTGPGSRAYARATALAPGFARRLVAALLGVAVAGIPLAGAPAARAVQAVATAPVAGDRPPATPLLADSLPGPDRPAACVPVGWTPDRPAVAHRRSARSAAAVRLVTATPRPEKGVAGEVVVRRGDSLWEIAERHLGPDASAAEVAAEWPRWHRANRAAVGPDPDLLLPGTRLVPPPGADRRTDPMKRHPRSPR